MYLQVYIFAQRRRWVGRYLKVQHVVSTCIIYGLAIAITIRSTYTISPFSDMRCIPQNVEMVPIGAAYATAMWPGSALIAITLWLMFYKYRFTRGRMITALLRDGLIHLYGAIDPKWHFSTFPSVA
ncbi:hypothetical protein CC1G_10996 [Coprinopsis cinerea okayama7|uniref:Uncharacterized protein n=1 Tax=Coprinopsis cinerea (strain Okayama-7 / 130 / ATCC MYA-4618 / FGSC 9003) TaxID=240176 RepID=A8P723_COPC7|nr:hypothetical protein CC1G_10996 [Coprinopsis cinerea okayama7\|eukprot:XP_001839274.2 hypothetical protein CC1G_10996 [Coprinopsis cinerea okayama7\